MSDRSQPFLRQFTNLRQFTKAVVGDRSKVTQLIPLGTGFHDYQVQPNEVQLLTQADVQVQYYLA